MARTMAERMAETVTGVDVEANAERVGKIRRLRRAELPMDTLELARYLIGKTLVHDISTRCGGRPSGRQSGRPSERLTGRIVETEAYPPGDAAAHSFIGETRRNHSLFLERGFSYVYFTYGCWFAMNVSSDELGTGAGVLLRGLEPVEGLERMRDNRRGPGRELSGLRASGNGVVRITDLARGPGRLASAMQIDKSCDGLDLCGDSPLWLGAPVHPAGPIGVSIRIGVSREVHRMYRFYEIDNPHVSGPRRMRTAAS
jgi:DNA-3-methyladenine glycosylase